MTGLSDVPAFRRKDGNGKVVGFSVGGDADGLLNQKID